MSHKKAQEAQNILWSLCLLSFLCLVVAMQLEAFK